MCCLRRCFQTTYEELKHNFLDERKLFQQASRLPMRNWNDSNFTGATYSGIASRLPMRNWNNVATSRQILSDRLPDYLWGIETIIVILHYLDIDASRLPMRNWNNALITNRGLFSSFQTTYEELKLIDGNLEVDNLIASRLPMRNWNYLYAMTQMKMKEASRLPMRNWNFQRRRNRSRT